MSGAITPTKWTIGRDKGLRGYTAKCDNEIDVVE